MSDLQQRRRELHNRRVRRYIWLVVAAVAIAAALVTSGLSFWWLPPIISFPGGLLALELAQE